jgi:hypothetical protein
MDAPADGPIDERTSALPSVGARVLAFSAIIIAGICGGLIGYAFTDLQCEGNCTVPSGLSAIIGAVAAAGGVAVVVVLALRAMGEWHTIQERDASRSTKS